MEKLDIIWDGSSPVENAIQCFQLKKKRVFKFNNAQYFPHPSCIVAPVWIFFAFPRLMNFKYVIVIARKIQTHLIFIMRFLFCFRNKTVESVKIKKYDLISLWLRKLLLSALTTRFVWCHQLLNCVMYEQFRYAYGEFHWIFVRFWKINLGAWVVQKMIRRG